LRITQELLNRSSQKLHMQNFKYTATTWPSFKEIRQVVLEAFCPQI